MSQTPRYTTTMIEFEAREQARRRAVENPGDVSAVLAGQWPPYSRGELAALSRTLKRGKLASGSPIPGYFARRVNRVVLAIENRIKRYGKTSAWSMTAPNGREVHFPINDYASTEFKKMVERYSTLYEKSLIDFIVARLGPEDVFVDVGANVGYISAFAASTGAAVFAIEIQRELIPLIEQMATINEFDLVRALHVGASARSGLSMMARIEGNPGTQLDGQTNRFNRNEPRSIVDDFVPMLALDDAFLDPDLLPALIKIDVEGHEIGVLEGASRIIAAGRTTFVVEFHPHLLGFYGRSEDEILKPFDSKRWSMSQLTDDGLRPITGMADVLPDPRDPNPKLVFEPRAV